MAETRILRQETKREIKRTILREAEERFNHELLDDEERQLLLDRRGGRGDACRPRCPFD